MANELQNAIRSAAEKVAQYVHDVATLTVETRAVTIDSGGGARFDQALPVARSIIKMDGDSETIVPLRRAGEKEQSALDTALYELHQANVNTAIEYRARILGALLDALKTRE